MTFYMKLVNHPANPYDPERNPEEYERYEDEYRMFGTVSSFAFLLHLAFRYGWQPRGFLLEYPLRGISLDEFEWSASNPGDILAAEDSASLADALEKALNDLPDNNLPKFLAFHSLEDAKWYQSRIGHTGIIAFQEEAEVNPKFVWILRYPTLFPVDFLWDDARQYITEFIEFCRKGEIEIG